MKQINHDFVLVLWFGSCRVPLPAVPWLVLLAIIVLVVLKTITTPRTELFAIQAGRFDGFIVNSIQRPSAYFSLIPGVVILCCVPTISYVVYYLPCVVTQMAVFALLTGFHVPGKARHDDVKVLF
jgi:hypothetical protein